MRFSQLIILLFSLVSACTVDPQVAGSSLRPTADVGIAESPAIIPAPCDGFDFPVGPPDARKYYNAQPFGKNEHLGDDWNGVGGGNTDKGDPVHSAADGIVRFTRYAGPGWGNVLRIIHNLGTAEAPELVETLYGHLDTVLVEEGDTVRRGQQVGTIGDAGGAYWAHLHFELRDSVEMAVGGGYSKETAGYLDPSAFIKAHRPKRP